HREADVIDRGPFRAAGRLLSAEEDEDVGEPDDLELVRAECRRLSAERLDEELDVRRWIARGDVMVSVDDRVVSGERQLRVGCWRIRRDPYEERLEAEGVHQGSRAPR